MIFAEDGGELMFTLEEDGSGGGSITGTSGASGSGQQATGARTSELSLSNNEAVKELRGTPPPGILVPVVGQLNNSGVVLVPRTIPHQPLTILSSSPHSHCSNHLSGNGCGHVSFDCRHVACNFTKLYLLMLVYNNYSIYINYIYLINSLFFFKH